MTAYVEDGDVISKENCKDITSALSIPYMYLHDSMCICNSSLCTVHTVSIHLLCNGSPTILLCTSSYCLPRNTMIDKAKLNHLNAQKKCYTIVKYTKLVHLDL